MLFYSIARMTGLRVLHTRGGTAGAELCNAYGKCNFHKIALERIALLTLCTTAVLLLHHICYIYASTGLC
jgi:hypothetical protein